MGFEELSNRRGLGGGSGGGRAVESRRSTSTHAERLASGRREAQESGAPGDLGSPGFLRSAGQRHKASPMPRATALVSISDLYHWAMVYGPTDSCEDRNPSRVALIGAHSVVKSEDGR